MSIFSDIINAAYNLMQVDISLYEYTFSFWSIFVWSIIASIIVLFIGKFFGGGSRD